MSESNPNGSLMNELESLKIDDKIYLCPDCLILYTQLGLLKNSFIVQTTNPELPCNVCNRPAKFVAMPHERGVFICEGCYKLRVRKTHIWSSFKVVKDYDQSLICDLCGKPGAKHILPRKPKELRPVLTIEEDLFGRD